MSGELTKHARHCEPSDRFVAAAMAPPSPALLAMTERWSSPGRPGHRPTRAGSRDPVVRGVCVERRVAGYWFPAFAGMTTVGQANSRNTLVIASRAIAQRSARATQSSGDVIQRRLEKLDCFVAAAMAPPSPTLLAMTTGNNHRYPHNISLKHATAINPRDECRRTSWPLAGRA